MHRSCFRSVAAAAALIVWGALPAAAAQADESALEKAFAALSTHDWGQSRAALAAIDDAVLASRNDPAQRRRLEQCLAACLQTAAPIAAKQFVCRRLSLIGTEASVPAIAPLLANPDLSHMARFALERIPGPAAAEALRTALSSADHRLKVGIINSLGARQDAAAVPQLTRLLQDADVQVARAAAGALGKIGTPEAAEALRAFRDTAPASLQAAATDAWIVAAERLAGRGRRAEAAKIFRQLFTAETDKRWRLAAFRGLVTAEPDGAFGLLSRAIRGDDDELRVLAVRLVAEAPDGGAAGRFLGTLGTFPPATQVTLLDALRLRLDAAARPVLRKSARSDDPAVRLAALRGLAVAGNADDVPWLVELAAAGRGQESEAARSALASLPAGEANSALVAMLPGARPEARVEVIQGLVARGARQSIPRVSEYLTDVSEPIRLAAWEAMAALGTQEQLPAVILLLKRASNERIQEAAEKALRSIVRRTGAGGRQDLLAGLEGANAASRVVLLRALVLIGDAESLNAVRAAVRDREPAVRDAAVRVLTDWPAAEAAPDLLQLLRGTDNPVWHTLAFRGYVRLGCASPAPPADKLHMMTEAMKLAAGAEEKRQVIAALAELREPAALELLARCLDDAGVVEEAGAAAVKVAGSLDAKHRDDMAPVLRRVIKSSQNPDLRTQARQLLTRLGLKAM
jgi:HEAT repeat protein